MEINEFKKALKSPEGRLNIDIVIINIQKG
jgi:hypothetical protein